MEEWVLTDEGDLFAKYESAFGSEVTFDLPTKLVDITNGYSNGCQLEVFELEWIINKAKQLFMENDQRKGEVRAVWKLMERSSDEEVYELEKEELGAIVTFFIKDRYIEIVSEQEWHNAILGIEHLEWITAKAKELFKGE